MNPSVVGRWERTPVVLPILTRLDAIDEPDDLPVGLTQIRREDLLPDVTEYIIGPGDLITVSVFELIVPNLESVQTRRVNEIGEVRLPVIGALQVAGLTPSQLERRIASLLAEQDQLRDATVSVIVQEGRQRTYSIIGEPRVAGTAVGTYTLPRADFRILEAIALARGVPAQIRHLYVIRQVRLVPEMRDFHPQGETDSPGPAGSDGSTPAPPRDAVDLIDELMQSLDAPASDTPRPPPPAPTDLSRSIDGGGRTTDGATWVNIDSQWVRLSDDTDAVHTDAGMVTTARDELSQLVTQRVIVVPYDRLIDGDMRYNIIIRPGDIIRVPSPAVGFVYIGGSISRPGAFNLPGERELTLKQLVFSAGDFTELAIPDRVDLIRRIDGTHEATVRVNLRAIFNGEQPDIFLKPNDTINIGTSFIATPLAVVRNGFRASYGFGFLLDRNFGPDVFGGQPSTN